MPCCCLPTADVSAPRVPPLARSRLRSYGYNDVGYHQSKPSSANPAGEPTTSPLAGAPMTPYLDELAYESMRLEMYCASLRAQPVSALQLLLLRSSAIARAAARPVLLCPTDVQPLCSPTRATIMTGRFTSHTGVGPNVIKPSAPYAVPKNETFMPELLKQAGYAARAPFRGTIASSGISILVAALACS